jgi:spermidine synthase
MSSGVYRIGRLLEQSKMQVLLHADGKTSTVSVTDNFGVRALRTNGKSDGAVRFGEGPVSHDEVMMTLAGALPQLLLPDSRHIANIGFGTGITTHVLLASDAVERVDTVEIEPAMVRAGAHFRPRNARALDDPRSRIHFEDAKTFFASQQARYDVIVSEPSNPWVSGVAGLFSEEFYRDVRTYLRDGGLLIQWIQLYEMTPALVATIITALDGKFTDYELWFASQGDMLVVAAHKGRVPRPDASALKNPRLRAELERFNIRNLDDVLLHRVAGRSAMAPYFAAFGVQANSDFFPVLDNGATRARFLRSDATEIAILQHAGFPLLEMFDNGPQPDPARLSPGERPWLLRSQHALHARSAAAYLRSGDRAALGGLPREFSTRLTLLRASLVDCAVRPAPSATHAALADLAVLVNQHLAPPEAQSVWRQLEASPCHRKFADTERDLLRLHSAISRRAPPDIAQAAGTLLMSREQLEPETVSRVLATYMAAQLAERNATAARLAFRDFRGALSDSPMSKGVLRFLLGHADNPVQP